MFRPAAFIERRRRSGLISALSNLRIWRPEVIRHLHRLGGGALVHDIHLLMPFFYQDFIN